MPIASSGNVITNAAQLGANVVLSSAIKDGEIVNDDIKTTAAIAIGKLSGVAASGANNDITSLIGLTTALAVNKGGTGADAAAGARTNLGLGNMAEQANNAVNIDGGTINGITDLAVVDGGTGASDAATARTNLGVVNPVYLGAWSDISATADGNAHQVATDGFIVGYNVNGYNISIKTDAANPPTVIRGKNYNAVGTMWCVPVKKNHYYLIATVGGENAWFWIPLGT